MLLVLIVEKCQVVFIQFEGVKRIQLKETLRELGQAIAVPAEGLQIFEGRNFFGDLREGRVS